MPIRTAYNFFSSFRNRHFVVLDSVIFLISPFFAAALRFDGLSFIFESLMPFLVLVFCFLAVKFLVFWIMGIYRRMWNMASIDELANLIVVGVIILLSQITLLLGLKVVAYQTFSFLPYTVPFLDAVITMLFISTSRFSIRLFRRANERINKNGRGSKVLIVGAGEAGIQVISEIQKNPRLNLIPVGFIDDNISKVNLRIRNVDVLGTRQELVKIVHGHDVKKVIVAMPTASGEILRDLSQKCDELGVEILTLPGISDLIGGKVSINRLRNIKIEDLLRRDEVEIELDKIKQMLRGKVVLVTGAGGSIGSELCRQILSGVPQQIILLGHGENSIFEIEQEILFRISRQQTYENHKTEVVTLIADIKNRNDLYRLFSIYRPSYVFHAAAHKHVPLMEANPSEAIWNNVIGTKNLVELSVEFGINKFILISTDKAVNPTSIMGASKRVAEMITLSAAKEYNCKFSAVRFGNVLGSRGSVIRTFQHQLKHGGPITITHPEIKRYFMTIPEAVRLVLQSYVIGKGGEIFVLDMGEPIKILDLAKDMIRLAGLQEGSDIQIVFSGLRPGEKLYEELFNNGEEYARTSHDKILIARNASEFVHPDLHSWIQRFERNSTTLTTPQVQQYFKEIIPEYQVNNFHHTSV